MKNIIKFLGIIALTVIIGFSMAACSNGSTGGGRSDEFVLTDKDLIGTWKGTAKVYGITADFYFVVTNTEWAAYTTSLLQDPRDYGIYTWNSNNTANIFSTRYKKNGEPLLVGTGVYIDKNTIRLDLNSSSVATGTHILTRQ
jgi:hypothetical protein